MKYFYPILTALIAFVSFANAENLKIPYIKNVDVKVDGKLNEQIYSTLKFIPFESELSHSGKSDTAIVEGKSEHVSANQKSNRFAIFHNDKGLYLTIVSPLVKPQEKLSATCEMPDGLYEFFRCDDMLEVYLDPTLSGCDYYWFMTNPNGNKTDLWAAGDPDRSWNGVWKTASTVSAQEWTAEFFFPYTTFNRTALGGQISLSLSRFKPYGMKRLRYGGEFRMPATWPEFRLENPTVCAKPAIELIEMQIKDDNTPKSGVLCAKLSGLPKNHEFKAKWHIMHPMKARGWSPEGNGPRLELDATPVKNSDNEFANRIDIDDDESLIATLTLYNIKGELMYMSEDLTLNKAHIIDGPGCELNYYTSEDKINVTVFLSKYSNSIKLQAKLCDSSGDIIESRKLDSAAKVDFSFVATALKSGNYTVKLALYDEFGGKEIARREFQTAKYPPAKQIDEVKISHFTRAIQVNGKDFASIGNSPQLHTFDLNFAKFRIQQYKKFDFNTLLIFGGYYTIDEKGIHINPKILKEFFANAQENNFKVVIGMGEWLGNAPHSPFVKHKFSDEYRIGKVRELVALIKDEQSLLGYEAYDEPEWFLAPEYLEKVYSIIKEADPYHIVTLNGCRGARNILQFLRASDLVSIDYYPSGKWPVNTVVPITEEMKKFAGYKPLRWWIQSYQIFNPAPPTKAEIVAMTYMVWAHGVSSILYFIGIPADELAEAQAQCGRENLLLADALTAPYKKELKVNGNTVPLGVYASLRQKEEKYWIITINQSNTVQNVSIEIPDSPKKVNSIFEEKRVNLKENKIKLTYQPWERKVFEVSY